MPMTTDEARAERSLPPINIHIHDALGQKDRERLYAILKKEMTMTVTPPKSAPVKTGVLTSEFWVMILMNVGVAGAAASSNLPPRYAALASAVSVFGYSLSRAIAKF